MMRCFIGVFLPDVLKPRVSRLQDSIRTLDMNCKFVEPENLHLTFSFLGELDESRVAMTQTNLDKLSSKFKQFTVSISGIKFIPSKNFVRVIALDVIENSGMLETLSQEIKELVGGDVKPPHLTLCRVKNVVRPNAISKLLSIDSNCGEFMISTVSLVKSLISRNGTIYNTLHEIILL